MTNMPESEKDAELAVSQGISTMGIHVNLDRHYPISNPEKIPTLIDPEKQHFWSFGELRKREQAGRISMSEVRREIYAQIELANKFKIKISHITTHHGLAFLDDKFFQVFNQISKETHLLLRNEIGPFFDPRKVGSTIDECSLKNLIPNKVYALDTGQNQPFELIDFLSAQDDNQSILILGHAGKTTNCCKSVLHLTKEGNKTLRLLKITDYMNF